MRTLSRHVTRRIERWIVIEYNITGHDMDPFRRKLIPVWVALVVLAMIFGSISMGCAGSNANRMSRAAARQLDSATVEAAALAMVTSIQSSNRFAEYRRRAIERGEPGIVLLLNDLRSGVADPSGRFEREVLSPLFNDIALFMLKMDVGEFRQDSDPSLPNYVRNLGEFSDQDLDDRFDQSTGDVSVGGRRKAVLAMELEVERKQIPLSGTRSRYEYTIRVKVTDGVSGTMIYADKFPIDQVG